MKKNYLILILTCIIFRLYEDDSIDIQIIGNAIFTKSLR